MLNLLKDAISLGYSAYSRSFNGASSKDAVLLYHSVGDIEASYDRYKICLGPELFKRQIEYLSALNKKNLILTFDDGFKDTFDIVFPLLLKYNMKAVIFVTVGFIEGLISPEIFFKGSSDTEPLSWQQLKEMADYGFEIGSHTITHPNLLSLDSKSAYAEIADSKRRIEDKTGMPVRYFAYPYGSKNTFDRRITDMVRSAGYQKAYTNIMGFNGEESDLYALKRLRIYSDDRMFRFKLKLNGSYNWVDAIHG